MVGWLTDSEVSTNLQLTTNEGVHLGHFRMNPFNESFQCFFSRISVLSFKMKEAAGAWWSAELSICNGFT